MALRPTSVNVAATATALAAVSDADSNTGYRDIAVKNTSAVTIYVGGPTVTVANGYPLAVGEALAFERVMPDSLPYGIVATGTATIAVLELGV